MAKKRKAAYRVNTPSKNQEPKKKNLVPIIVSACAIALVLILTIPLLVNYAKTSAETKLTSAAAETEDNVPEAAEESQHEPSDVGDYIADITVEGYGTISVLLSGEDAPITVENFVNLAQSGFYDGLTFHRIMDGFMMQGGDPTGTGNGGSGTNIKGEFEANGVHNHLSHTRGAISMARATDNDSASSQFFIVQSDSTFLDGNYAAFGYVTEGMEYVDAICADAQPTDDNGTIPADQQPIITSVTVREA